MASIIGNRKHAAQALEMRLSPEVGILDGWKLQGTGAFRNAYLHIASGVVYKVDGCGGQWGYTNQSEKRNAKRLAQFAWEHVAIPLVSMFTFKEAGRVKYSLDDMTEEGRHNAYVIAMEFIDGKLGREADGYQHPGYKEFQETVGWKSTVNICTDMHGANFIIRASDNKFVPIDLAS